MIKYYDRESKEYETEDIAGEKYLRWTYESPVGMGFLKLITKKKVFSKMYGSYCDRKKSTRNINEFINQYNINMSEAKQTIFDYKSFNDFFYRELTAEARPIEKNEKFLMSPADGRILVYEDISLDNLIQVKGFTYSLKELIKDYSTASIYNGGTCMVVRLCPTDYHRFHFIDKGICSKTNKIDGDLFSVNPIALKKIPELYCRNKREWSVFSSNNFGDVLYVEVGATCVGTIVQSYEEGSSVEKGQEKGYFKFGGSTVILFFEPNKIKIDDDIIIQTKQGFETKVNMGEKIGEAII